MAHFNLPALPMRHQRSSAPASSRADRAVVRVGNVEPVVRLGISVVAVSEICDEASGRSFHPQRPARPGIDQQTEPLPGCAIAGCRPSPSQVRRSRGA